MPLTPTQVFDRIERAQASWTRGGASIAVSSNTTGAPMRAQFRLDVDGSGTVALRIKVPAKGAAAATDQAYILKGARLTGIDYVAGERLSRPAPDRGPVALRLMAVVGQYDDAVGFLLSREIRARYLNPLRSLPGWHVMPHGLERRTTAAGRSSLTQIVTDASGKITGFHIQFPTSRLDWTFAYGPARRVTVPSNFKKVDVFTVRTVPPHYATVAAQNVANAMLAAEGRAHSAIVRLNDGATLWYDNDRIRYEGGGRGFAYDGTRLIVNTGDATYEGRSSRLGVIDYVAGLEHAVDPIVRSVLVRTPPFAELLTPDATVRRVGTMSTDGRPCDVLEVKSPRFRASIFVDQSTHLPLSVESSALGPGGQELTTVRRTLNWSEVGQRFPRSIFDLRRRGKSRPLPPHRPSTAP